jgi:thiol-disulfide isomerase/thioredoxin
MSSTRSEESMAVNKIGFTVGLATGIALTLVVLNAWGRHLDRMNSDAGQPQILNPMRTTSEIVFPSSSGTLPAAWVPEFSGQQHDLWNIRALDGHAVTLDDFKGKVVFLNFWSTSCAPCIAEMPGMETLLDSLKNERVVFLAVTQDDETTVRGFLKKQPMRFPTYLSSEKPPNDLFTLGIPTTFILDTRGAAVFRYTGPVNWDNDRVRAYIRGLLK